MIRKLGQKPKTVVNCRFNRSIEPNSILDTSFDDTEHRKSVEENPVKMLYTCRYMQMAFSKFKRSYGGVAQGAM